MPTVRPATGPAPWLPGPRRYDTGAIVSRLKGGIIRIFTSETDNNVGNDPGTDDGTYWRVQVTGIPIPVVNKTGAPMSAGDVVYMSGAFGSRMTVALADASDAAKDEVIAVLCADLVDNEAGFATAFGLMFAQDTSAWGEGNILYLSGVTPGLLTLTPPAPPIHAIEVAHVVRVHATQGELLVHVGHEPHQFLLHTRGVLTDVRETFYQEGGVSGSQEIDAGNGNHQEFTMTGNVTGQTFVGFTNGVSQTVVVDWIPNGFSIGAWAAAIDWGTEGAPTTPPDGEWMRVWLTSRDGGTTLTGTARDGFTE